MSGVRGVTVGSPPIPSGSRHSTKASPKDSGTFRTWRYEYRIGPDIAPSFTRTVRASGGEPRTENARLMTRPANATEREILDLAPNARVTVLDRVRYIDGAAVSTALSVLPAARVPRLATVMATDDSLDAALRRHYGYTPVRQWSQSRLASPSAEIAQVLRLRGRPPQILLRGLVSCAESGNKLEYVESYLRPDVFDVVTEVGKWWPPSPSAMSGSSPGNGCWRTN